MVHPEVYMQSSLHFPAVIDNTLPFLERLFMDKGRTTLYKKNEVIFNYWDEIKSIYYLSKGCCLYLLNTVKGGDRALGMILPGSSFGEIGAIIPTKAEVRVEAVEDSEVVILSAQYVRENLKLSYDQTQSFIAHIYNQNINFVTVASYFSEVNVPQRFALFLKSYVKRTGISPLNGRYSLPVKLTMDRLGAIISANRVTTSTLLNFLRREKIIIKTKDGGFEFSADFIDSDFIKNELINSKWCGLKVKKDSTLKAKHKGLGISY